MKILFTGVGRRVELLQAFRQAALVLDKSLQLYGADMDETAPALAYCNDVRIVCPMKHPNYINELLKICTQDHIDLLIPTIDTDLLILSQSAKKFEEIGTKVLISNFDKVRLCRNKKDTAHFFADCGLKTPVTVSDWEKYNAGFPAFIKPTDGSSSINAFKVSSAEEFTIYSSKIESYIVQQFIEGTEYTVDIFCDFDGNPVYITPRIRLQVRAGEVLQTKIDMNQKIIEECKKIIQIFKPVGPITVQLIRQKESEEDYFIEINPRFGGGSPLSMKAGARSAETLLKLMDGEKVQFTESVENGAIFSRFDQSIRVDKIEHIKSVQGVIFDLDDTLYSEKQYVRSGYEAIANFLGSHSYTDKLWDYFEKGMPAIDCLLDTLGKAELRNKCLEIYRNHKPKITLYKGVTELIHSLKSYGIKIGIITDGRPEGQRNKIKALGLTSLVDDIIITDELGGIQFRKPCDIAFRILQTRWKLQYEDIVYVGDNPRKDFQASQQLGMKSLYLYNQYGLYTMISAWNVMKIWNIHDLKIDQYFISNPQKF